MRGPFKALRATFTHSDPEIVEFLSGFLLLCFGGFLFLPYETFANHPLSAETGRRGYDLVAAIFSEIFAASSCVALGAFQLMAINAEMRSLPRALAAAVASAWWVLVFASLFLWAPQSTATPVYPVFVLGTAWLAWRHLRRDAFERSVANG